MSGTVAHSHVLRARRVTAPHVASARIPRAFGAGLALAGAFLSFSPAHAQEGVARGIVTAPAETLHVTMWGAGDPIVIVPGIWSSTYGFRKLVPPLVGAGARVIVIEPLGVASSSRPAEAEYSMTAQAARIRAVLDTLRVPRAVFVGQALSTAMLLRLELENPGRVLGLLSLEGAAPETSATPGMHRALAVAAALMRMVPGRPLLRWRLRRNLENVSADRSWITPDVVDGYMAPLKDVGPTIRAYRSMAASSEPYPLVPRLSEIRAPVHLMIGTAPHFGELDDDELARLRAGLRQLRVIPVEGAGHLLHEERPAEVVAALLELWRVVAGHGTEAARPTSPRGSAPLP